MRVFSLLISVLAMAISSQLCQHVVADDPVGVCIIVSIDHPDGEIVYNPITEDQCNTFTQNVQDVIDGIAYDAGTYMASPFQPITCEEDGVTLCGYMESQAGADSMADTVGRVLGDLLMGFRGTGCEVDNYGQRPSILASGAGWSASSSYMCSAIDVAMMIPAGFPRPSKNSKSTCYSKTTYNKDDSGSSGPSTPVRLRAGGSQPGVNGSVFHCFQLKYANVTAPNPTDRLSQACNSYRSGDIAVDRIEWQSDAKLKRKVLSAELQFKAGGASRGVNLAWGSRKGDRNHLMAVKLGITLAELQTNDLQVCLEIAAGTTLANVCGGDKCYVAAFDASGKCCPTFYTMTNKQ